MKRVLLLIVVPALLVAMGFAQTPASSGDTDQINIKGCLGGTDGSYTLAEDDTARIFKITTSSPDLKAYQGQRVTLIGRKVDATENTLAVTEVNMISEHCNAAPAAPAAAASAATASAPAETIPTLPVDAAPAAAAPAAAAPAATASVPAETVPTPPAAAAPVAAVSVPAETASAAPAAAPIHRTGPSARPPKSLPTPAAAPAEPVSTAVAHEVAPVAPDVPSPDTSSTPAAAKAAPKTSSSRSAGMFVAIVVVLLLGAGVPLYTRWRRRKLAEETKGQNLSFTNNATSDPGKSDTTGGRKAA